MSLGDWMRVRAVDMAPSLLRVMLSAAPRYADFRIPSAYYIFRIGSGYVNIRIRVAAERGGFRRSLVGKGVARRETGWLEKKFVDFPYGRRFFGWNVGGPP